MRLEIVTIGNSQGVRLPKSLLMQCGFQKTVDVEVRDGELVLRKTRHPREGWTEAFSCSSEKIDQDWLKAPLQGNEDEWQWS